MTIDTSSTVLSSKQSIKILNKISKLSCRAYPYNTSDCVDDLQFNTNESCTVFTAATDNQSYYYLEYIQLSDSLTVMCISGMVIYDKQNN